MFIVKFLINNFSEIHDIFENSIASLAADASDSDEEDDIADILTLLKDCESLIQVTPPPFIFLVDLCFTGW